MARVSALWRSRIGFVAATIILATAIAFLPVGTSRAAPDEGLAAPENKNFQTKDGGTIHATYYKSPRGKDAPVVVLLHMKDGNRFIWQNKGGLAERLQEQGYAVLTVDLRFHGESKGAANPGNVNQPDKDKDKKKGAGAKKPAAGAGELKPADYKAMAEMDMEAVKKFIFEEHQAENLNMNKMGIVGAEMGASVATYYAAIDWAKTPYDDGQPGFKTPRGQDVRALVLISPQSSFHGLVMSPALNELRSNQFGVAFLVCVGKDDPQDKNQAKKIFDQASALPESDKRMYKYEYPGKLRGTDLLGRRLGIEEHIMSFFEKHLRELDSPWRDRESRLNRKK